jgi:hypothetical protein
VCVSERPRHKGLLLDGCIDAGLVLDGYIHTVTSEQIDTSSSVLFAPRRQ